MPEAHIPYLDLRYMQRDLGDSMHEALDAVWQDSWFVMGDRLEAFEQAYAHYTGTAYCRGVANGLDALSLGLRAMGVGPGDEVLVPSNTYIASWLAVTHCGARPVPVEPDPDTGNLDATRLSDSLTAHTKAVMAVHLHGAPCDMEAITSFARQHHLGVIEDNAQAQGAAWDGRKTGSWSDIAGHSFYPGKNLGALGDAGAITTDNPALAEKISRLRNYGSNRKYIHEEIGWNSRLDTLQAAFLSAKLPMLDRWNAQRQLIAEAYTGYLKELPMLSMLKIPADASPVWHIFPVRCERRDQLQQYLLRHGIQTLIHYPIPPHLQGAYKHLGWRRGDFPIAEKWAGQELSLPIYPGLMPGQVEQIAQSVIRFFDQAY